MSLTKRMIAVKAAKWARTNGLKEPLVVGEVEVKDYGYEATVTEKNPPCRAASCRFDKAGKETLYELLNR